MNIKQLLFFFVEYVAEKKLYCYKKFLWDTEDNVHKTAFSVLPKQEISALMLCHLLLSFVFKQKKQRSSHITFQCKNGMGCPCREEDPLGRPGVRLAVAHFWGSWLHLAHEGQHGLSAEVKLSVQQRSDLSVIYISLSSPSFLPSFAVPFPLPFFFPSLFSIFEVFFPFTVQGLFSILLGMALG